MISNLRQRVGWTVYLGVVATCLHLMSKEHGFMLLVLLVVLVPGWLKVIAP